MREHQVQLQYNHAQEHVASTREHAALTREHLLIARWMKFKKLNQVNDDECWQGSINRSYARVCAHWNLAHAQL